MTKITDEELNEIVEALETGEARVIETSLVMELYNSHMFMGALMEVGLKEWEGFERAVNKMKDYQDKIKKIMEIIEESPVEPVTEEKRNLH